MKIAVLSGKGGAGKTFAAVHLACAAQKATYVDCDVEEPNGRLFLRPEGVTRTAVSAVVPGFNAQKCTGCRKCVDFCRFNALIYIKDAPRVFPAVCHGCGGCALVCPEAAVRDETRDIGVIEDGTHGHVRVITGVLHEGEASGVGVIRAALKSAGTDGLCVIDCPPGSACSVTESIADADYCVLVAEPTAFGLHNFKMVHELCRLLGRRCGVIVNKEDAPYPPLEEYIKDSGLDVLLRIPYSRETAALGAKGLIAGEHDAQLRAAFAGVLARIGGNGA